VTVTADLEERIRGVVRLELDPHRDALAELVDEELGRIVRELVAERLNGAAPVNTETQELEQAGSRSSSRSEAGSEERRTCTRCRLELPLSQFPTGRTYCAGCKRKADRERRRRAKAAGAAESAGEARRGREE
jgi:hypothetical protein